MLITLRKKAQSTAEYVMLFAIVLGAVAMARSYLQKAIAGGIQYQARQLAQAVTGNPETLYDSTKDAIHNHSMSARQNDESQNQRAGLNDSHVYNETSAVNVQNASIAGDLEEITPLVNGHIVADDTWSNKDKVVPEAKASDLPF